MGVDMDDLFAPGLLHRHLMLSASAGTLKVTQISLYGDVKWVRGQIEVLGQVGHR